MCVCVVPTEKSNELCSINTVSPRILSPAAQKEAEKFSTPRTKHPSEKQSDLVYASQWGEEPVR